MKLPEVFSRRAAPAASATSSSSSSSRKRSSSPSPTLPASESDSSAITSTPVSGYDAHVRTSGGSASSRQAGDDIMEDADGHRALETVVSHEAGSKDADDQLRYSSATTRVHTPSTSTPPSPKHDVEKALPPDSPEAKKQPELQDQTNLLPFKQIIIVFLGLSISIVVTLLDQTIVSTALPNITKALVGPSSGSGGGGGSDSSWIATAYLLAGTATQPLYGRFSDIFGRKRTLLVAMAIFTIGSLACALSQSLIQLIIFRAIAGAGGGGILTLAMVIISDVVSLRDRGKYQGIIGITVALSNGLGPVIGGLFSEKVSWRWCFWINLPLGALAMVVIIFALPLKKVHGSMKEKLKAVDYTGSLLVLISTILLVLGLTWGGTKYPWVSAAVLVSLILGGVIAAGFCFWEWKGPRFPLMPMYVWGNITVAGVYITQVANGIIFFIDLYYIPQFYQIVHGYSAILSGVLILPLVLMQTLASFATGWIISRTGRYRYSIMTGWAIWTIGLGLVSTFDRNTSVAKAVGYLLLVGIGAGQTFQSSLIAAQAAVDRKDMAVVTGLRNFIRQLGGTFGLALGNTIVNNILLSRLSSRTTDGGESGRSIVRMVLDDPLGLHSPTFSRPDLADEIIDAYTQGFRAVFLFCVAWSLVGFFVTAGMIKHHDLRRDDDKAKQEQSKEWLKHRQEKKRARAGKAEEEHAETEGGLEDGKADGVKVEAGSR